MGKGIIFIAIDVDDKNFHGCTYELGSTIRRAFSCRPNESSLIKEIKKLTAPGQEVRVCYEATYIGYTLCRALRKKGVFCEIIAPSLIPYQPGKRQKTDRIDAQRLAEYYGNGQLTAIEVPEESTERLRDLIRSRNFIKSQFKSLKLHILSECRRCDMNYKANEPGKKHWTTIHMSWLKKKIKNHNDVNLKMNFRLLLDQLAQQKDLLAMYDQQIELASQTPEYKIRVDALCSYRGIAVLTAMTIITELGDIRRFSHPRKLTGYIGLDLREYSSGGKERRYGITKIGNRHVRTALIEASQSSAWPPNVSRRLKQQRNQVEKKYVEVADRCMKRMYRKATRLLHRGKNGNKVKVACAREMLGFIWESLQLAV